VNRERRVANAIASQLAAVILFLISIVITIGAVTALGHEFYILEKAIKSNYNFPFYRYFQLPETPIIKPVPEHPPSHPKSYPSNHQSQTDCVHHHPP
jgi:hypothetical protein